MAHSIPPPDYDREAATAYAARWALGRNPRYLDFAELGGDCTNFVSQCLFAGCRVMDYTPVYGWYYNTASDRTASWTGVGYLYRYLLRDSGTPGPQARLCRPWELSPGDVVQLGDQDGHFYHSLLVVLAGGKGTEGIYVSTHDNDAAARPLSSYHAARKRFLHIHTVNRT